MDLHCFPAVIVKRHGSLVEEPGRHAADEETKAIQPGEDFMVNEFTQSLCLEDREAFEWPACPPPSDKNLAIALKLCAGHVGLDASSGTVAGFHSGWSAQDCIKAEFSKQIFIVKVPREHSTSAAYICGIEATRTNWAAEHGAGPNVYAKDEETGAFAMEFIKGETLSSDLAVRSLPQIIELLQGMHRASAASWMRTYNPITVVKGYLQSAKQQRSMSVQDIKLIESTLANTEKEIDDFHSFPLKLVPCHNDFHSHNIMQDHERDNRFIAIDFEDTNLGDPMWDLAYLTVNLEKEPLALAGLYGTTKEEKKRLKAYHALAIAHCATWSAIHGPLWVKHYKELIGRLKHAVLDHAWKGR